MKRVQNPHHTTKSSTQTDFQTPRSVGKMLTLALLLGITACNRTTNDLISPQPSGGSPKDSLSVQLPDKHPTDDLSGSPTDQNPDPVSVYQRTRITWAPSDYQEIRRDAAGVPVHYTSQYLYAMGTDQVRRTDYQLQYDSAQRLTRVDQSIQIGKNPATRLYTLYQYEGNQLTGSEEFSSAGYRLASYSYQYSAPNQLRQIEETHYNSQKQSRKTFQYDGQGNLTTLSIYWKSVQDATYKLETVTHFEQYDNQKNVENLFTLFPLLPGVQFRANNYQTKIVRAKDGTELSRETVRYLYNEQGYPTQKTVTGAGGSLTATYSY
ncbi:hypothetical protein ACFPMF_05640 [Larkinella bovis]|uniref:YD repeat-containing protein n=1 Tax=Larkinella bovis TaxID=683041 RepID=A0ABW0I604_9BACT